MVKYFKKRPLTIPSASEVFLLNRGQEIVESIDGKLNSLSVEQLKTMLSKVSSIKELNKFRLALFSASKALSNHGIAPRWQGLKAACETDEQYEALTEDAPIIDLYWLSVTFPKHKTINQRWQSIFTSGFDIELALGIGERQITTSKKIRQELNLSRFQQVGCIHFLGRNKDSVAGQLSAQSFLKSTQERAQTRQEREIKRSDTVYQVTEKIAAYRALIYKSWLLADKSPTNAAKVYKWMTGLETNRGNVARTVKRMTETVSRSRVE